MAAVIRRYEVTDDEWEQIKCYIPEEQESNTRGRPVFQDLGHSFSEAIDILSVFDYNSKGLYILEEPKLRVDQHYYIAK